MRRTHWRRSTIAGIVAFGLVVLSVAAEPTAARATGQRQVVPVPALAVNLNGSAVSVNGVSFSAEPGTPNVAVSGIRACSTTPLLGVVPAGTADLMRCFIWGNGAGVPAPTITVSSLSSGDYDVYLWAFEDNVSQTFSVQVNGTNVTTTTSGPAGTWQRVGPLAASPIGGTLTVSASGGDANLSAIELWPRSNPGPTTTTGSSSTSTTATTSSTSTTTSPPAPPWSASDFVDELVVGGLTQSLSADWLPDGRLLVLGKTGQVTIVNPVSGSKVLLFTVPDVDANGERGALDLLVSPEFASTGDFYVYYSAAPSTRLRIMQYTMRPTGAETLATARLLWENPGPAHSSFGQFHIGGSLTIGPDDHFYLTVGDGLSSSNSQLKTNVFGKVLRIARNGSVPPGNPFADGTGTNIDEIWALGLRNPFRSTWDLVTNRYFLADVGGNNAPTAYEEINLGAVGANYGWPLCEGPLASPKNGVDCPAGITGPIVSYAHAPTEGCCLNASITGGEVARSAQLPPELSGAFIYGDYAQSEIRWTRFGSSGSVISDGVLKTVGTRLPVWISIGPDGHIYYVHFNYGSSAELRRLRFAGELQPPPTITASGVTPESGRAPLTVQFSASVTYSGSGPVTYLWDFGDGQTSTGRDPVHTYAAAGIYTARLTATAGGLTSLGRPLRVEVGRPPTATITSPAAGTSFAAGETLTFTGSGIDPDGVLPADGLQWTVLFLHDNHSHPTLSGVTGTELRLEVEDSGHDYAGDTGLRIELTAVDADGLSHTTSIDLEPRKVPVLLQTNLPEPGVVTADGVVQQLPFTVDTIEGFNHTFEAPALVCIGTDQWRMVGWDAGTGTSVQFRVGTAPATLTARYEPVGTAAACTPGGAMRYAVTGDRTGSLPLAGASIVGGTGIYAFLAETEPFIRVEFWLDDPTGAGPPRARELATPFDFAGGTVAVANVFDTSALAVGNHSIRVVATRSDGTTEVNVTSFAISGAPSPTTSTTRPTSSTTAPSTTTSPTTAPSTTAPSASGLLYSRFDDRRDPVRLQGASLSAASSVYPFLAVSGSFVRVQFWLDDPSQVRAPIRTELMAPYDLGGGTETTAQAFPLIQLASGSHVLTAVALRSDGSSLRFDSTFQVAATTATTGTSSTSSPGNAPRLLAGSSPDRANAVPLDGLRVTGTTAYIFLEHRPEMVRVSFTLDGSPHRTELLTPWDFDGGSSTVANGFALSKLAPGSHRIAAVATLSDGRTQTVVADFET